MDQVACFVLASVNMLLKNNMLLMMLLMVWIRHRQVDMPGEGVHWCKHFHMASMCVAWLQ